MCPFYLEMSWKVLKRSPKCSFCLEMSYKESTRVPKYSYCLEMSYKGLYYVLMCSFYFEMNCKVLKSYLKCSFYVEMSYRDRNYGCAFACMDSIMHSAFPSPGRRPPSSPLQCLGAGTHQVSSGKGRISRYHLRWMDSCVYRGSVGPRSAGRSSRQEVTMGSRGAPPRGGDSKGAPCWAEGPRLAVDCRCNVGGVRCVDERVDLTRALVCIWNLN